MLGVHQSIRSMSSEGVTTVPGELQGSLLEAVGNTVLFRFGLRNEKPE